MIHSLPMKWWMAALVSAVAVAAFAADGEESPLPEEPEGLEIEPPILIKARDAIGLPVVAASPAPANIAKLEKDLARAKSAAASGDRMFKAGIIAKVEAEDRVLRVVRLEAQLAQARLEQAKSKAEEEKAEPTATEIASAEEIAKRTAEERHRAEIEAALRNLQRQQKLLALGSGRKADVSRAEKRLADVQGDQSAAASQ